jgi:hypothetical protein
MRAETIQIRPTMLQAEGGRDENILGAERLE